MNESVNPLMLVDMFVNVSCFGMAPDYLVVNGAARGLSYVFFCVVGDVWALVPVFLILFETH